MSRAQAVVNGVVAGLAVGLLAGLAVVNLENLREAAEQNGPAHGSAVAHGETYEGDGEQEARLVQAEAERLVYVRTVAPSAQYAEGLGTGPFRLRTGTGYTLVLPSRQQPYSLAELTLLAPDTLVREADATYLLSENVAVLAGATLDIRPPDEAGRLSLRLSSDEEGFVSVVALGGAIAVTGTRQHPVDISSWNPREREVDTRTGDGRAYLRAAGGSVTLSHVNVSDLGFWSGPTGGLSITGADDAAADPVAAPATAAEPAAAAQAPGGAPLLEAPAPPGSAARFSSTVVFCGTRGVPRDRAFVCSRFTPSDFGGFEIVAGYTSYNERFFGFFE